MKKRKVNAHLNDIYKEGRSHVFQKSTRCRKPEEIVVAVPIAPKCTADLLRGMADDLAAVEIQDDDLFLGAVGAYYREFSQVDDGEVVDILDNYDGEFSKRKRLWKN